MKFKNILKILYNTPAPLKNIHPKIKKKFYFGADKKRKIAKRKKKKEIKIEVIFTVAQSPFAFCTNCGSFERRFSQIKLRLIYF